MAPSNPLRRLVAVVWGHWHANAPWQRIVKNSVACTVAVIIALLPPFRADAAFMIPMVTVFAHPGQRLGLLIESLLLILFGSLLGLSWSLLGLYLSSLVQETNPPASGTLRGLFLLVCVLIYGYVRSSSPRLFNLVFFLLVTDLLTIQLPSFAAKSLFNIIYVPILLGGAVVLLVNLCLFPELSSDYLGSSTIDTLSEAVEILTRATHWFITPGGDADDPTDRRIGSTLTRGSSHYASQPRKRTAKGRIAKFLSGFLSGFPNPFHTARNRSIFSSDPSRITTLARLTEQKPKLRAQLSRCKAAQDEINFEISISPLPPTAMKPISTKHMTMMVQNVITLIGACENKFIVVSKEDDIGGSSTDRKEQGATAKPKAKREKKRKKRNRKKKGHSDKVESVKPIKEIEAGSAQLLESILARIRDPVQEFQESLTEAVCLVVSCVAYCYDVPTLPSGAPSPKGIPLEEIDLRVDRFISSLALFDSHSSEELKRAAMDQSGQSVDFMPRMETFLVSSFILAFRDSAAQVLEMLRHARHLVEKRQHRRDRSRLWMPQYTNLGQWLHTGGEVDATVVPENVNKVARTGRATPTHGKGQSPSDEPPPRQAVDEEACIGQNKLEERREREGPANPGRRRSKSANVGWPRKTREKAADIIEWAQDSDDVGYALKLAIALFAVTWPALVASLSAWYAAVRGIWAPMQLILVFEVAIGTSLFGFALRMFGVVFGCVVGYLAYVIGRGNHVAVVVVLVLGIVPSVYIQVATKYVKAGMVAIVSTAVVALAALNGTTPAYEVFYRRLVAFLVGGSVALLVEIVIAPVRARDRLVQSLSASVRHVQKMQAALAVGIDGPEIHSLRSHSLIARFSHARDKAQGTLAAAETFLPFCLNEPRLKGSFKPLAPVYQEIIYVLHQIIDRMDNVVQLRIAYGSSILEDLNPKVYAYRRNVAASTTLILFSVNEALTTWLPLPQFIPSARLAQLRLINRVREILILENSATPKTGLADKAAGKPELDEETANLITQRKFLSWNASTAGETEIIEYLEELVELVKLLVGVNAFRSGMLERPNWREYTQRMDLDTDQEALAKVRPTRSGASAPLDQQRRRRGTFVSSETPRVGLGPRRAATLSQQATKLRPKRSPNDSVDDMDTDDVDAESQDALPRSLQRVGTRLRQDHTAVRRRAFTFGGL